MNENYAKGLELFKGGMSLSKISKELGISRKWFTEFLKGQGIDTNPTTYKVNFNRDYFKVVDSEQKAYWLGFLFADGCINEQYKNGKLKAMTMELAVADVDIEHLYKLCDAIDADRNIVKPKKVTLGNKEYLAQRLVLCSTSMCRDLIQQGMTPRKSFTTFIPDNMISSPYLRHFVRGLFDGDGHIILSAAHSYGVSITSASVKMLVQLKVLFANLGCADVNIITDKAPTFELRFFNAHDDKIALEYMYDSATVYLARKYETFIARRWRNSSVEGGKYGEAV